MKPIRTFHVAPSLPPSLEPLRAIAWNLRWAWDHDAIALFRRLDPDLWETSGHNPVRMLGSLEQVRLETAAVDDAILAHLDRVHRDFQRIADDPNCWFTRTHPLARGLRVAYFSAEFGLTECLSIFAGGLGVLAGDHLKSASDLGIPMAGVSLLYQQGYFRQYLNQSGWQQEDYSENDFPNLPVTLLRDNGGNPLAVTVEYPGRIVRAQVWLAQVGRVPLYLLDTNVPGNSSLDRDITDQLYGGDREMRIRQEILLGIGGCRALRAVGFEPTVCHMNEGHSAFLALERVRLLMNRYHLDFAEARELASAGLIFTGHTPVEAGHDYFPPDLVHHYLGEYGRSLGLSRADFLGLGRRNPADDREEFCMTVLALRLAAMSNGVSRLHGEVSRRMWQSLWPGVSEHETPIAHVTNGVHFRSWISEDMNLLFDRYMGLQWREEPANGAIWGRVERIPPEELWRTHERRRERMVAFARRRLREQLRRRGAPPSEVEGAAEVLDPDALTIGFARRFATYKRATLLLRDPERLARILNDPGRPVQVIFAGKAHPRDEGGKELIRTIVSLARDSRFRRRLVFLEDYDMGVSRYLVQGADVWLNTPLRPLEASGTSGMKAAANGALNLSVPDGWWEEAWRAFADEAISPGWTIGRGEHYDDPAQQDLVEAEALYGLLENDVVPAFYDRSTDHLPRRWVARMKQSLSLLCRRYNTHRMLQEYAELYLSAHARVKTLESDEAARARVLGRWLRRVREAWPQVGIVALEDDGAAAMCVGQRMTVRARLRLGSLSPDDVTVELYMGGVNARQEFVEPLALPMAFARMEGDSAVFEGAAGLHGHTGRHGYTVRALPFHADLAQTFAPGLIIWADAAAVAPQLASAAR